MAKSHCCFIFILLLLPFSCLAVSNSFWSHGPRDFPGKNTGVGCHFLLQEIFSIQRSNSHLLPWQMDSLHRPPGKPVFVLFRVYLCLGLPWWLRQYSVCLQCGRPGFNPWVRNGSHQGCQVPFRPPIPNVGLLLRRCSWNGFILRWWVNHVVFSSCGGILELRRGIQVTSCLGQWKSNLPFELPRKAGDCSRVTAGPIDLI